MKVPSVYEYERFSPFFAAYFEWRKSVDPKFSYRWLERRINSASYSMLAMIATGRRLPSLVLLKELAPVLNLEDEELQYAELMVEIEKSHNPTTREMIRAKMDFLKPSGEGLQSNFDTMQFLGDWHHAAILQMIHLKDFECDPTWIAKKLQNLISAQQATESIALLRRLGLISTTETGQTIRTQKKITPLVEVSRLAVKNYHKQFLDRAKEAVLSQNSDEQHLSASAMTVERDDIKLISAEIEQFISQLTEKYASTSGDATYQLSLQLLPLTSVDEHDYGIEHSDSGMTLVPPRAQNDTI